MAYTPTIWQTGDTITEDKLNKIEQGILANSDYDNIDDKPSINGVELSGNKSTVELGIDHVPLADNLVATTGTTDTTPYVSRASQGPIAELRKVVGGTLAWNQLFPTATYTSDKTDTREFISFIFRLNASPWTSFLNKTFTTTGIKAYVFKATATGNAHLIHSGLTNNLTMEDNIPVVNNHAYFLTANFTGVDLTTVGGVKAKDMMLTDLTALFGSTIADAIATMETTTAGSGVALFRSLFPADYYPYSAPTLQSVQTSARQALDGNGNVTRSYPLDSALTLRGIPKLTNGKLEYDGDEYLPSGQVARRYWEFDLGSVTFYQVTGHDHMFYYALSNSTTEGHARKYGNNASGVAFQVNGYTFCGNNTSANIYAGIGNMQVAGFATTYSIVIRNDSCSTPAELKTALNGVHIVYPLETPTTETADHYTEVQLAGETEQFVSNNYIPVGNESFYPTDLTGVVQNLAPLPTTAGTYKLQVTVSNGTPTYSWVTG